MNLDTIAVNAFPLIVAGAVALYKFIVQFLPQAKHAQLASLVENLQNIATTVVQSTEQFMNTEAGPVKKAQASTDIATILAATGIHGVPTELIDHAIEAAVYDMNLYKPDTKPLANEPAAPSIPVVAGSTALQSLSQPQPLSIPASTSNVNPVVANTTATATVPALQSITIL